MTDSINVDHLSPGTLRAVLEQLTNLQSRVAALEAPTVPVVELDSDDLTLIIAEMQAIFDLHQQRCWPHPELLPIGVSWRQFNRWITLLSQEQRR